MIFFLMSFFHFVKMLRYILIEAMTKSIIDIVGRYLYLTNTLNHAKSAFFHGKKKGCTSWVFLLVLSNFFFLQKHKKKHFINPRNVIAIATILNESCDHERKTNGEGEE